MAGSQERTSRRRAGGRTGSARLAAGAVLLAVGLTAARGAEALSNGWRVASAQYRVTLEKDAQSPWPAEAGTAQLYCPIGRSLADIRVSVFSLSGRAVPSTVFWAAEGEPAKILFDTSAHEPAYEVYLGADPGSNAAPAWEPRAGLMLETREYTNGPLDTLAQVRALWDQAPRIFGRSLVPKIFDGIHYHGPSRNFIGRYTGVLAVSNAGEYGFATVSDNASFLLIDGQTVVEWPGNHSYHSGIRGEHNGKAQLKAGTHRLEYFRVQKAGNAVALVAWKRPGQKQFEIMGESALVPVAGFHAVAWDPPPGRPRSAGLEWDMAEHATAGEWSLVTAEFRAVPYHKTGTYRWGFDDGTTATGGVVRHVFLCPGLRSVRLEATDPGGPYAPVERKIAIHPRWLQAEDCPRAVVERQKAEIMARDWAALPVQDLRAVVMFAAADQDRPWVAQLGEICTKRKGDLGSEYAGLFYTLADNYEQADVREWERAQQAYQTFLDLKPADRKLEAQARLHLAGLLIEVWFKAGQAGELLRSIDPTALDGADRRLQLIYLADILLAQGDDLQARAAYGQIGSTAKPADALPMLKQGVRLESARNYITRREFDAAYRILKDIEWETPVKRMSTQTGFPLIRTFLGRKEYPRALARCLMLANVRLAGDDQASLLYLTAETYGAMGQKSLAQDVFRRLVSEFPNSEAAARAKDEMQR